MNNKLDINQLIKELHQTLLNEKKYILYSYNDRNKLPKFILELDPQTFNFNVNSQNGIQMFKFILEKENNESETFNSCFDVNLKEAIFLKYLKQFSRNVDSPFTSIYTNKSSL